MMANIKDEIPPPERDSGLGRWVREIESAAAALREGESLQLIKTRGIARSWIIHGLSAVLEAPVVVVLPSIKVRERVRGELSAIRRLTGSLFAPHSAPGFASFPSWELTPYVDEWVHPRVASCRVAALTTLAEGQRAIFLTTPEALVNRLVARDALLGGRIPLKAGMSLEMEPFLRELIARGYTRSVSTELPGDFSVRGGVLDVYSPLEEAPVRIEYEGDEVVSLRCFDPVTQRTVRHVSEAVVGPVQELYPQLPFPEIREKLYALQMPREGKRLVRRILNDLEAGGALESRLWLSPYLFDLCADFFSYLPERSPVILWDPEECRTNVSRALDRTRERYEKARRANPVLPPPEKLFLFLEELEEKLFSRPHVNFGLSVSEREAPRERRALAGTPFYPKEAKSLKSPLWSVPVIGREIRQLHDVGYEVWVAEPSEEGRKELIAGLVAENLSLPSMPALSRQEEAPSRRGVVIGELPEGCVFPEVKLALITRQRPWTRTARPERPGEGKGRLLDVATFRDGDPLVHLDYGIGLYRGLKPMEVLGKRGEFLEMEYAKGDRLLVPVDKLDRVQRYVGSGDTPPPLDTLGTPSWEKRKAKLREDVAKTARELLELYALRKAVKGHAFERETEGLSEFEAAFPYQETPDQKRAIEDIFEDMASETPMDRLVCGDVGFGKTEVAMRAAFKAVMEGKQVAVLVPTTVLAEQHYVNFSQRFSPYPVRVELLSRFRSRSELKSVVTDLAKGRVDIMIGTHRLLQKDVKFRDLGLLVVDEEHRFGVTHKELLKKLSGTVDVLTLTATPIPRTLQMSLSGLRDLSLINTPPRARLPIVTKVARFRKDIIIEGIERELSRGGQVFFVHNRVRTISKMAALIQDLVPEATVVYAHGQMEEKELETVMLSFMRHEIDVLVCTTIIESGVDIPNVNTLFVHHAEQFGLSTLYQLRGRIGRSDRQAYAYFLIPHRALLPREAIKRLQSLQEFSSLGSGFKLSLMDLNMRGGGDLLGKRQSGRIAEVGFELYTKIIEEEVKKLKGQWTEPEAATDLKLPFPTLLPERYIPEMGLRLMFYRRLSRAETLQEIDELEVELKDRFGAPPIEAKNLLDAVRLKVRLTACGMTELYGKERELVLSFSEDCELNRDRLVTLLQSDPRQYRLSPSQKLIVRTEMPAEFEGYLKKIYLILKQLTACDKFSQTGKERTGISEGTGKFSEKRQEG